jgi:hypothetical protein
MRPEDLPLDTKLLAELKAVAHRHDVSPIFLRNYSAGKCHPISKPFQTLVQETHGLLAAVSDQEICALARCIPESFRRLETPVMPLTDREDTVARLAPTIVEWRIALLGRDFREIVRLKPADGEVLKTYPELAPLLDDDNLLILDDRFKLTDGAILYKEHALYYHQFLRRNFTASPNFDFLGRFANYVASSTRNMCRVALDHSRLIPREFYERMMELDAWYGPPWDAAALDDPNAVGLTVVGRNQYSLFGLSNKLRFTDFLWTYRDGIKTFQVEEVSEPDYIFGPFVLNRYIHSERDIGLKQLRHLDGAVKVYPCGEYESRIDTHLPDVARCQKQKLFRVDGNIELEPWLELIGFFFKSNEMILEYFDPEAFKRTFEHRVRDFEAWRAAGKPEER